MKNLRLAAPAAALILLLAGCQNRDEPAGIAAGTTNELLRYVPDDTPYVAANLQPLPDDVIDFFLDGMRPALEEMQARLTLTRAAMEEDATSVEPRERLIIALLEELDGKLNRAGLESLGLDLASHKVIYGTGAYPVIRIGLSDAEALRAAIQRVLDRAGLQAPQRELEGESYWRVANDEAKGVSPGLYVSIRDGHLAAAVFPQTAESTLLPRFLGLDDPDNSGAADRLLALNREQGYAPYGSGIVDLRRLADEFLQPESLTASTLGATGAFDPAAISRICRDEILGIIAHAPRMTIGTTELSTEAAGYQYHLETRESLATELRGLVAEVPAADAESLRVLEFAFGMRFGPVRDLLRQKIAAIVAAPYQCEHLRELNEGAVEALASLDRPVPPLINNFKGLRIALDEIQMGAESIPTNGRGHIALHVEQPQMFVGMAQMFVPDLSTLALKPGEPPARLPERLVPLPGLVVHAALGDDAIGLAIGAGEESTLPDFLNEAAASDGTFLSVSYETDTYLDYSRRLSEGLSKAREEGDPEHANDLRYGALIGLAESFEQAARNLSDRSYTELKFTTAGLVVNSRIDFEAGRDQ